MGASLALHLGLVVAEGCPGAHSWVLCSPVEHTFTRHQHQNHVCTHRNVNTVQTTKTTKCPPRTLALSDHCFFTNNSVSLAPTLLSFLIMRLIDIITELPLHLNIESWAEYCSVYSPKSPRLSPNSIYVLSKTLSSRAPHHSLRCMFSLAATSQPFQLLQCAWWSLAGRHWCPKKQKSTRREGHKATFTTISDFHSTASRSHTHICTQCMLLYQDEKMKDQI